MRVLIGVDGSSGSFAAAKLAGELLSSQQDNLVFYYSPPQLSTRNGRKPDPEILDRVRADLSQAVFDKALAELAEPLRAKVRTIVGTQKPRHGLLVAADEYSADMIIVGARGAGPMSGLNLGSVGRTVAHGAHVPVLVVRSRAAPQSAPLNVLLATDGSECSRHAAHVLHKLTWPERSVGRLVTVIESLFAADLPEWLRAQLLNDEAESFGIGSFEASEEEKRRIHDQLVLWCGELPWIFQGHKPRIAQGDPAQQILNTVESEGIDLVVVGARGLGPVGRLLVGSTSERLLTHAPCSVLIVRQPEKP